MDDFNQTGYNSMLLRTVLCCSTENKKHIPDKVSGSVYNDQVINNVFHPNFLVVRKDSSLAWDAKAPDTLKKRNQNL